MYRFLQSCLQIRSYIHSCHNNFQAGNFIKEEEIQKIFEKIVVVALEEIWISCIYQKTQNYILLAIKRKIPQSVPYTITRKWFNGYDLP